MTSIAGVGTAVPPYRYPQREITEMVAALQPDQRRADVLRRFHGNAGVRYRNLALPLEQYRLLTDFTAANDEYIRVALSLATDAFERALDAAGVRPDEVDAVFSTTVTGLAVPSIEARLVGPLGLRADVRRTPMFGLGCVAGAAGLARTRDYLAGAPDGVAVLLAVELCSLTVQRADSSIANFVASGLFGDGAAAVVMVGRDRAEHRPEGPAEHSPEHLDVTDRGVQVVGSRSAMFPDTARTMGWDIGSNGFTIVLNAEVPALVERYLEQEVKSLLAEYGLELSDVDSWICHPGGPKVIDAIQSVLKLDDAAVALTRASLAEHGNLSSVSVLEILNRTLSQRGSHSGWGVLMAMGPGFCAELVLLRWP